MYGLILSSTSAPLHHCGSKKVLLKWPQQPPGNTSSERDSLGSKELLQWCYIATQCQPMHSGMPERGKKEMQQSAVHSSYSRLLQGCCGQSESWSHPEDDLTFAEGHRDQSANLQTWEAQDIIKLPLPLLHCWALSLYGSGMGKNTYNKKNLN